MPERSISVTGISCPGYKGIKEEEDTRIEPLGNVIPVPAVITKTLSTLGPERRHILTNLDCPFDYTDVDKNATYCGRTNHMRKAERPGDSTPVRCPYATSQTQ